jgi:hypothetical protein
LTAAIDISNRRSSSEIKRLELKFPLQEKWEFPFNNWEAAERLRWEFWNSDKRQFLARMIVWLRTDLFHGSFAGEEDEMADDYRICRPAGRCADAAADDAHAAGRSTNSLGSQTGSNTSGSAIHPSTRSTVVSQILQWSTVGNVTIHEPDSLEGCLRR